MNGADATVPNAALLDAVTSQRSSAHDADPDTAIAAIRGYEGPLLADLDETLYLRNSTEDFIDSARPAILALLLLRVLDLLKPWRWTGGELTRDLWRVRAIRLFFPWVSWQWRARVGELARRYRNEPLLLSLSQRATLPIIATIGFQSIVGPLVAALGLPQARIVAANSFEDRRRGKLHLVLAALGEETVRKGMVITDSLQDLPLLNACARPIRTIWPEARYRPALSGVYLPGQYLTLVKRPGERYIVRGILQEDFAFWILASIALAASPVLHVIGLSFLLLSFWAIYERGYVDNDLVAAQFELDPKLSAAFAEAPVATPPIQPWIWAALSGVIGIVVLRSPLAPPPLDFALWAVVLVLTHGWFYAYNRFDKTTRVWMFPILQLSRAAGFAVLVPIMPIGAAALAAHVLARWMPYYVYRCGGTRWPDTPFCLSRLMFFVVIAALLSVASGPSILLNWTALALFAWNLFRARQELRTALMSIRRIDDAVGKDRISGTDTSGRGQ